VKNPVNMMNIILKNNNSVINEKNLQSCRTFLSFFSHKSKEKRHTHKHMQKDSHTVVSEKSEMPRNLPEKKRFKLK
jgi:hypothetical protein